MRSIAWVVAPFLLVAPPASAEIFKCAGKSGVVVLQNFRCEFDSLGSLPSAPTPVGSAAANTAVHAALRVEPTRTPTDPQVGMSVEDVRAIWGEPTDSHWEEPGEGERSEVWLYGDARSVRFIDGLVAAVRQ